MTQAEAAATGLFEVDVPPPEGCEGVRPLAWAEPYTGLVDVLSSADGTIISMGVLGDTTLATDTGIRVGSTHRDIVAAYGDRATEPAAAGFGQTGVYVQDGDAWIGFLFDVDPSLMDLAYTVTFMEVTRGEQPRLIRSGC